MVNLLTMNLVQKSGCGLKISLICISIFLLSAVSLSLLFILFKVLSGLLDKNKLDFGLVKNTFKEKWKDYFVASIALLIIPAYLYLFPYMGDLAAKYVLKEDMSSVDASLYKRIDEQMANESYEGEYIDIDLGDFSIDDDCIISMSKNVNGNDGFDNVWAEALAENPIRLKGRKSYGFLDIKSSDYLAYVKDYTKRLGGEYIEKSKYSLAINGNIYNFETKEEAKEFIDEKYNDVNSKYLENRALYKRYAYHSLNDNSYRNIVVRLPKSITLINDKADFEDWIYWKEYIKGNVKA